MPTLKTRLEGESRIEQIRRLGTYESYREDFETWIIDEQRTHTWISAKIGKSKALVTTICRALGIDARVARARPKLHSAYVPARVFPATLEELIREERDFQRMRVSYCAQWDRGW
jgi:hypothetical protein